MYIIHMHLSCILHMDIMHVIFVHYTHYPGLLHAYGIHQSYMYMILYKHYFIHACYISHVYSVCVVLCYVNINVSLRPRFMVLP